MSDSEHRQRLRRQYLSTGLGELVATAVFVILLSTTLLPDAPEQRLAISIAFLPFALSVVPGGIYWLLARVWVLKERPPTWFGRVYRIVRWIGAITIVVTLPLALLLHVSIGTTMFALVIWAFGLVEYLNYFVVRLAYPWTRWVAEVGAWRTPRLVRDLRESLAMT